MVVAMDDAMDIDFSHIEIKPIFDNERLFDVTLAIAMVDPTIENLAKLKATIMPQKIRASFIVEGLTRSGIPEKISPAIEVIAQACPYAFFIANNKKPIDENLALKYLRLGFIYPAVNVTQNNGETTIIPITQYPIYLMAKAQSAGEKAFALNFMEQFLVAGLNLPCKYKDKKGIYRDLHTILEETTIAEDDKNKFKTKFAKNITKVWEKDEVISTTNMFRSGSLFDWSVKGKPFIIKDQHA
jgi:hypothetical protein